MFGNVKKWAGNKVGGGAPPAAPGGKPPPFGKPPVPGAGAPPPRLAPPGAHGAPPAATPPLFNPAITSATLPPDQAQWAQVGGKSPERPDNPPAWVDDEAAWERAKDEVKKHWDSYEEPWAVVATVYENMKGG